MTLRAWSGSVEGRSALGVHTAPACPHFMLNLSWADPQAPAATACDMTTGAKQQIAGFSWPRRYQPCSGAVLVHGPGGVESDIAVNVVVELA